MPSVNCLKSVPVTRSQRVMQLEGMFDVPPCTQSEIQWEAHIPFEERPWQIGLIVGPSGCGKTTLARELFGEAVDVAYDWPRENSLLDAFPAQMGIREIALLLSSVGFSSPPSWLRPFHVLSNGEQFRASLARGLAESSCCGTGNSEPILVVDEFTSVVDRTVAQVGSAAVAKAIRRRGKKFVALSCHYDIIEWLNPDWTYEPSGDLFQWRCERRREPRIDLNVSRVASSAWSLFKHHHYLCSQLNRAAKCFLGCVGERPAVFTAVLPFPHPHRSGWREHRTVCLPDFQGVGLGNAMSEFVAGLFRASGKPYFSTTASPAMIRHRAGSPLWNMLRKPSRTGGASRRREKTISIHETVAHNRLTAGFEYVGPARVEQAREFGLLAIPGTCAVEQHSVATDVAS